MLTVIEECGSVGKHRRVAVKCDCGTIKTVNLDNITKQEGTKSCGCKENKANTKHGKRSHLLYGIWNGIKNRCYNKNRKSYKYYGGKGVVMCDEWLNDFESFFNWCIGNGWEEGYQIDKDIKGNGLIYSPEMCCIVTPKENSNTRSNSQFIEYNGVRATFAQFSELYGIKYHKLYKRINQFKWTPEKALLTP
jgi:hypothetical protein